MKSDFDKKIAKILHWHRRKGHWEDDESWVMDDELAQIKTLIKSEVAEKIYEDWEIAIRLSQNDEDDVPIEKRNLSENIMINHIRMSKQKYINLTLSES